MALNVAEQLQDVFRGVPRVFGSRTLLEDTLQAVFQTQAERSEISTGRGLATQTGIRDRMRWL